MRDGADQTPDTIDGFDREFVLEAPGQALFTLEDCLEIDSLCSLSGIQLVVSGVMLTLDLTLKPFAFLHTPNSNRTIATTRQHVGSGWLQHVRVVVTTGTPLIGQCFAWVRICRGLASSAQTHGALIGGYVTANTDLYAPGGVPVNPLDGEGAPLSIAVATPGAGADFSQTVPAGARWEFIAAFAQLATAVAVATRAPRLVIDDGANTLFEVPAAATQAASLTVLYTWGAGAGGPITTDAGDIEAPIPNDIWLPAGFRVRSATGAIQAADQWSTIRLLVREWLEGN